MQRYVCVHGHFYQPPRENPWLEEIEIQDEAYPFHDWNERITDECYAMNATSRILNERGNILQIVNNYARISFNFGPTLLTWLERHAVETYQAILDADRESQELYGGHGSALAQVYNHMIMPLANERDKRTQTIWGMRDFEHRFGRKPDGMWLSETAVDLATLEILVEQGLRFTILEPHQAGRIRPLDGRVWKDVSDGKIDPSVPYRVCLPSGRSIDVFFYDGPASRAVAFENLLGSGETFADRLTGLLNSERRGPQLAHIATDGESYGHHHRFGDMALAYALQYIEERKLARLTNYAQYLTIRPPEHVVEIVPDTSWSCAHGVERWRSGCGCGAESKSGWSLDWRGPLRDALDLLRDNLVPRYESMAGGIFTDPWQARDEYIAIILDRSPENVEQVLTRLAGRTLTRVETVQALKLLEMQRQAMLMYTSCGWFFEDVGRIETVQILEYAARALQLAEDLFGESFEGPFLKILEQAESNDPVLVNGAVIYESKVRPAIVDLPKVGAHFAMTSLFNDRHEHTEIYCYKVTLRECQNLTAGRARLAVGRVELTSRVTLETSLLSFGVLHLGDHNIDCGVWEFEGDEPYGQMVDDVVGAFRRADVSATIRALDRHFANHAYSLRSLFRDEQRRILDQILHATLGEVEGVFRHVYEDHAAQIRFLDNLGAPLPEALRSTAEVVINIDVRRAFEAENFDPREIQRLFDETKTWRLDLDIPGLSFVLEGTIERYARELVEHPERRGVLERLNALVELSEKLPFTINAWTAQNDYYRALTTIYPEMKAKSQAGDMQARGWVDQFAVLGRALSVYVE